MSGQELCFLTATELARCVRANELSAIEVMEAHLTQISWARRTWEELP